MVQKVCPSFCVLFASCRGAGAGLRNPGAIPVGSRYTTEWPTGSECDQIFPTHSYAELNTLPKIFTIPPVCLSKKSKLTMVPVNMSKVGIAYLQRVKEIYESGNVTHKTQNFVIRTIIQ